MKRIAAIAVAVALLVSIVSCTVPSLRLWDTMVVLGSEYGDTGTTIEGNIMAVFYEKASDRALFWISGGTIVDCGDGTWNVTSPQVICNGVNQDLVAYGLYQYKPLSIGPTTLMAELDLQAVTAADLPHSEHIAKLIAVNATASRPATIRRRYMGVDYDIKCLVSQTVRDQYVAGTIQLGDFVVVSFIEEIPNGTERHVAVVMVKIFNSWG